MKIRKLNKRFIHNARFKIIKGQIFVMIIVATTCLSKPIKNSDTSNISITIETQVDKTNDSNNEKEDVVEPTPTITDVVEPTPTITDVVEPTPMITDVVELVEPTPMITSVEDATKVEKKLVALTFDDGPGKYTDRLLEILEKNKVKATFFVVGTNIKTYGETVKKAYDLGHEIGIHGYSHTSFKKMTIEEIQNEITTVYNLLTNLGIQPSNLVRPPYGDINSTIKESLGYSFILWSVDPEDWKSLDKDMVIQEINKHIEEGAIILLHDIHKSTIEAVEEILPQLVDKYEFVTVNELFNKNEQELEEHNSYRKVKVLKKVEN